MTVQFKSVAPSFVVSDLVATAEYYRDVLGFKILGYFADPPVFAMLGRGGVEIHFGKADAEPQRSNLEFREISSDAYIWVDDVEALHQELIASGADIIEGPTMRIYNCVEMEVRDCNGFKLVFSQG
jgi:catechol 2,3-dioxygenase-like lactoylglutathione lyase family enzyme